MGILSTGQINAAAGSFFPHLSNAWIVPRPCQNSWPRSAVEGTRSLFVLLTLSPFSSILGSSSNDICILIHLSN